MAVNSVGSNTNTSAISSTISSATGGSNLGEQDFLKLLTTQLSNQDPLAPQDQAAMLAQLAQFSTVEGVNNLQASSTRLQATALLGRQVAATTTADGTVTNVIGQVTSVRFATDGIHLDVQDSKGNDTEVMMADVTNVGT